MLSFITVLIIVAYSWSCNRDVFNFQKPFPLFWLDISEVKLMLEWSDLYPGLIFVCYRQYIGRDQKKIYSWHFMRVALKPGILFVYQDFVFSMDRVGHEFLVFVILCYEPWYYFPWDIFLYRVADLELGSNTEKLLHILSDDKHVKILCSFQTILCSF